MAEAKDFRNCGWSKGTKKGVLLWKCKKKDRKFYIHDLGLGLCPCFCWIKAFPEGKEPEGDVEKSLF